jgi:hypothetical protein
MPETTIVEPTVKVTVSVCVMVAVAPVPDAPVVAIVPAAVFAEMTNVFAVSTFVIM